jgi:hypothetical protein
LDCFGLFEASLFFAVVLVVFFVAVLALRFAAAGGRLGDLGGDGVFAARNEVGDGMTIASIILKYHIGARYVWAKTNSLGIDEALERGSFLLS